MIGQVTESIPLMKDVRQAQFDARRNMAIARWPLMLLLTVVQGIVCVAAMLGGLSSLSMGCLAILMGSLIVFVSIFGKKIVRAGVGAGAPLVLSPGSSGLLAQGRKPRLVAVLVLAAGVAVGIAIPAADKQANGPTVLSYGLAMGLALLLVASVLYSWLRTRLWEYLFAAASLALLLVCLGGLHFDIGRTSGAVLFMVFGVVPSLVMTVGFFVRWNRWIKSLPPSAIAQEE